MILDIDTNKETISIHKEYPIKSFNWTLEFIFNQGSYSDHDISELTKYAKEALNTENIDKFPSLFQESTYNSAITISNKNDRKSCIILTKVTTIGQFVNSLVHEMLHLSRHIDKCENSEELFTILGDISGDITNTLYKI